MSITFEVTKNTAGPAIARLQEKLTPQRMAAAAGPACARLVQRHLRGLGSNKRGWPSTHFYARAAKATNWQVVSDGALVSVNQMGMRQRYRGGPISAVHKRMLTIPISPVAHGKVASDFPGSFILRTRKGAYIVQPGEQAGEKGGGKVLKLKKGGGNDKRRIRAFLNFLFMLRGRVQQKANPGVLPSMAKLRETAASAILGSLQLRGPATTDEGGDT